MKRKVLGYTAVDSGQLMVIDPAYINGHWKKYPEQASIIGVKFWGAGQDTVAAELMKKGYTVNNLIGGAGFVPETNKEHAEALLELIDDLSFKADKTVINAIHTDSTYDTITKLTMSEDRGGQMMFDSNHPGLGVAFASGFGDGMYEVAAYYIEDEYFGERIAKVEIVMISEGYEV